MVSGPRAVLVAHNAALTLHDAGAGHPPQVTLALRPPHSARAATAPAHRHSCARARHSVGAGHPTPEAPIPSRRWAPRHCGSLGFSRQAAGSAEGSKSGRHHNIVVTATRDKNGCLAKAFCEYCAKVKVKDRLAHTPRTNYRCHECHAIHNREFPLHPDCAGAYHNELDGFCASFGDT